MEIDSIDSGRSFDFGKTASVYARYRDIYPESLYDRLRELGVAAKGTVWLDLGTGTGVLPMRLCQKHTQIIGVDLSEAQISFAAKKSVENGWQNIRFLNAPAEETHLPDHSFDVITAAQCFFYFDKNKMKTELRRLLKPGGRFIKIFMDWDENDPVAAGSCALVRRWNPQWRSGEAAYMDMKDDLFPGRITEEYDEVLSFTRESWHGRMCACRGTLASMSKESFHRWEREHLQFLSQFTEPLSIRHRITISFFDLTVETKVD